MSVINFPIERRIEQMLNDINIDELNGSMLEMHLDILNDIVLEETTEENANLAIKFYCQENELDPDGFELHWAEDATVVTIAEG